MLACIVEEEEDGRLNGKCPKGRGNTGDRKSNAFYLNTADNRARKRTPTPLGHFANANMYLGLDGITKSLG